MDRFTVRRKLLRGSLSAPLVLTVASPSALATPVGRQSFEACLLRAGQDDPGIPQGVSPLVASPDTWLRAEAPIYKLKLVGSDSEEDYYFYDGLYYPVSGANCTGYPKSAFNPQPGTGTGEQPPYTTMWGLVYVDDGGAILAGFGPCPAMFGFAVSNSCWASFQAGKNPH